MKTHRPWLLAFWLLFLITHPPASGSTEAGPPAGAAGGLLLSTGQQGSYGTAPILGTAVDLRVSGIVARGTVRHVFLNPTDKRVEAIYVFPLSDTAAVDGLRIQVGDRVVEGRIEESGKAATAYALAKEAGFVAALVEQHRPNVFTAAVGNVGPGETVEVEISLQQTVEYRQGTFTLRLPLVVGGRYAPPARGKERPVPSAPVLPPGSTPVNPVAIHVDLRAGFPLRDPQSPSHAVRVQRLPGHRFAVDLQEGVTPADADFVLEWRPDSGREPQAAVYAQELNGERYVLLMVVPPTVEESDLPRIPRETVFVVDTSGSMAGGSLEQAKRALTSALARLQPDDRFNVVQFNSTVKPLFPASVPASPETVEEARRWVQGLAADGGTNMLAAMKQALPPAGDWQGLRQLVFITDGQVGNEADLFQYIAEHLGESRLFTVGIGAAPNAHFMRKAAEFGRGTSTTIESVDRVEKGMGELLAALDAPVVRDVQVSWDDPAAESWPKRLPDLYLGAPLLVVARLTGTAGEVVVSGTRGDLTRPWEVAVPLAGAIPGEGIDKLWARQKIESLIDNQVRGADDERIRQAVTRLGLRHGLLTPYTSLVAVDVTPSAAPGEPVDRHTLPLNSTSGLVSEQIVVTGSVMAIESASSACTFEEREVDEVPGWPDPWSALRRTPGVLIDQPGPLDSRPPLFTAAGSPPDQSFVRIDGAEISDADSLALFGVDPGLVPVDEVDSVIGGADLIAAGPGARLGLQTKYGSNELRGSAWSLWAGGGERQGAAGDELSRHETSGLELGGPLRVDHLWLWGYVGRQNVRATAPGGLEDQRLQESGAFKLGAAPGERNTANLSWSRGDATDDGWGSGADRTPEDPRSHDGRMEVLRLEDSLVLNEKLFVQGAYAEIDRRASDLPLEEGSPESRPGWRADAHARDASLEGRRYSEWAGAHDLGLGARWRDEDERTALAGEDDSRRAISSVSRSVWGQDTWRRDTLQVSLGLRYDDQRLGGSGVQAGTLSPRLEALWSPAGSPESQWLGGWGRFASRLGTGVAARLRPDESWQIGLSTADLSLDPGLRPETMDEWIVGFRRTFRPESWAQLRATWRRRGDLLESRLLVRDRASGALFAATAGDWVPGGSVAGLLPDGTPYEAPWFDLRPGLAAAGRTLLVNGDRREGGLGVSAETFGRTRRFTFRGHVIWQDWSWRQGPESARFDDPTRTPGEEAGGALSADELALLSRWSFHLGGTAELPGDFLLSASLHGHEGWRIQWFHPVERERAGLVQVEIPGEHAGDVVTLDARLARELSLRALRLTLSLEAFNLTGAETVLSREADLGLARAGAATRTLTPRVFRLGVRTRW